MLMGRPQKDAPASVQVDRLAEWQALLSVIDGTPISGRSDLVQRAERIAPGLRSVATVHGAEHDRLRFGSHVLYETILDVVVDEIATAIRLRHPDATEASVGTESERLLARIENDVAAHGASGQLASTHHYGAVRFLLSHTASKAAVRRLWATVFAFVWTFGNHAVPDDFLAVAAIIRRHVGGPDFHLLATVLHVVHRLFGVLPGPLGARMATVLSAPAL
jgi:hypothetical protein